MSEGYTMEVTDLAVIVRGAFPIDDMKAFQAVAKTKGFDILDTGIASALEATMVITSAANSKKLRERISSANRSKSREEQWLRGTDTGVSSRTIFHIMTGRPSIDQWGKGYPLDPDDFGRCYRLLQWFPEWRERMGEMKAVSNEWARLVDAWDELTGLFDLESPTKKCQRLYDRMQELIYGRARSSTARPSEGDSP
jgi:hypothetical protein